MGFGLNVRRWRLGSGERQVRQSDSDQLAGLASATASLTHLVSKLVFAAPESFFSLDAASHSTFAAIEVGVAPLPRTVTG